MTGPRVTAGRPAPTFVVRSARRGQIEFLSLDEAIASVRRAMLTEILCGRPAEVTISTSGRAS
ncbi:hypothetical protein SAMN06297251_10479 [Fulvimarina manganoxydans]|uniref:Uncharacterized protein n=1 Tax=Fulvimarina manganoxydans TaxID=937218 RepID=A0A1W2ADI9_9HYPH|nr:hypothetical protein [Fulvimarina manganoxydans]SMC58531.1 hypothetical protein SAMN06297251_10479 [Fulvimarina manganoxydans]